MKSLDDSCPLEHAQFGAIAKCPWCDAARCPRNMPDHITLRHWEPDRTSEGPK